MHSEDSKEIHLPWTTNHAIKSPRIPNRLAYLQTVLCRPRNKHRLRLLAPFIVVPDNFRFLLFHPQPTPVLVWVGHSWPTSF